MPDPSSTLNASIDPSQGKSSDAEKLRKPFPWPILLAFALGGGVTWLFWWALTERNDVTGLRMVWNLLCSVIPGISLMIILGSIFQFPRRPLLSAISFVIGSSILGGAWWMAQRMYETRWLG